MRALVLIFSASAALASPARAEDAWLGRDKALHFGVSAALAGGGYGLAAALEGSTGERLLAGAALSLTLGAGKEAFDALGGGDPSLRDLAWDALGTAGGLLLAWAFDQAWSAVAAPAPDAAPATTAARRARRLDVCEEPMRGASAVRWPGLGLHPAPASSGAGDPVAVGSAALSDTP